jgi:Zn finger protein HypA/HybF involved in hydrogenase expression
MAENKIMEKCAECGRDIPESSESQYCPKCDAILDKKFSSIEANLLVFKEITEAEIVTLNKFAKEDIIELYLKLYGSFKEDGVFDQYESAILNKLQKVFEITEKEIGSDKVVKFDESMIIKKQKKLECIKCSKPVLKEDFLFCPYCGFSLE